MASETWGLHQAIARPGRWEILMVALSIAHGALLYQSPGIAVMALGLWWNSNTISHNFIHRPFFRWRVANGLFGAYLSILLGIPQALWRDRHLAHHAGIRPSVRPTGELLFQVSLVLALWMWLAARAPRFFVNTYLPGYLAGLCLCALQGYFEHVRGATSHYGSFYNTLFFNDGYHAEHHANPAIHWTRLPRHVEPQAHVSAWPAVLRWIDFLNLESLERLALWWPALQRFVLRSHTNAFRGLIDLLPPIGSVGIVGGGLFPRTALILERLLPGAQITIIDAKMANLDRARQYLHRGGAEARRKTRRTPLKVFSASSSASRCLRGELHINFVHARYPQDESDNYDLLVIPLSFEGDRAAIYQRPPAAAVIVHDWIWRRRGISRIVSIGLLKRLNLVVRL